VEDIFLKSNAAGVASCGLRLDAVEAGMRAVQELGKLLFILGLLLAAAGLFLWRFSGRIPLGRLPGDIAIDKPGWSFHFPIMTCILVSIVLTLLMWLLRR
jgi:hypothetical protein